LRPFSFSGNFKKSRCIKCVQSKSTSDNSSPGMFPPVDTKDPTAVQMEVQAAYKAMFPNADLTFVPRVFSWAVECFVGKYKDYQAIDAAYHDFEHTMQGVLCMARLLRGRQLSNTQ